METKVQCKKTPAGAVQNWGSDKVSHPYPVRIQPRWWISTWRWPLQPWMSAEIKTTRWAPETDPQWRLSLLDSHRDKTSGTRWDLSTNCWFRLARGELAPRLSLVSPKVFSPFCHWWSFGSLPLSPLAYLVRNTYHFQRYRQLDCTNTTRTELDDDITEFNDELPLTEN